MENLKSFEDLKCWQACRNLRVFVKQEIVTQLPTEEKFRLIDQIIRSSRSSTANIAEGYGRFHYLDNAKFCSNARGSCWETLDHLITANDDNLINNDLLEQGRSKVSEAIKILNGYITYLQKSSKKL
jgi:four helix bundle protein